MGGRDLFDRLLQTRGSPDHPLNADFLDKIVRPMLVANRDLRWTEWIRRRNQALVEDLRRAEERWRRRKVDRSISERLRARWVMWTLTSTVREFRDRATRALYWFGRRDPAWLFHLTLKALAINDPYVSERMLASSYGVCMALHCRPKRLKFRAELLPLFAKRVYKQMFAPAAPYSTTHALSRDFARRIVELGCSHAPGLLNKAERMRVVPPFTDGGIRKWEVMEDPNEGKYRAGNAPLGMDFANYTLGGLVPKRRNYDSENEEYKKVVGQITWRIYQLGYSLEQFGEIDKEIASLPYLGRSERPVTERYGKKYARIAYFELYGFRDDAGLLKTEWYEREERPSDIDIDPSFPDREHEIRLIEDFLGKRSRPIRSWVQGGTTPEFRKYLIQQNVAQIRGEWLLLDGHSSQQDKAAERVGFVFLRSVILLEEDVAEFVRLLKKEPPRGRLLPDVREDHYTFAGEIPWCDTFHHNELETVDFAVGKVEVPVSPDDPRHIRIILDFGDVQETIGPREVPKFENVVVYRRIPVYIPVRQTSFPSNGKIERTSCVVPAKELAELFHLWLNLPTWDMYDESGQQCSIATAQEEGRFFNYERQLFFRREMIDKLFASQKLALVWVVWGERQHRSERRDESWGYKNFHQVYRYVHGQAKRVF